MCRRARSSAGKNQPDSGPLHGAYMSLLLAQTSVHWLFPRLPNAYATQAGRCDSNPQVMVLLPRLWRRRSGSPPPSDRIPVRISALLRRTLAEIISGHGRVATPARGTALAVVWPSTGMMAEAEHSPYSYPEISLLPDTPSPRDTSPLKKGATAGLPSSAARNTRENTAGQASSGTLRR